MESAGSKPTRTTYIKSRRKQQSAKLAKRKRVKQPPRAEMQPTREPKAKGGTMGVNRPNKSTKRDTGNQKESRTSRQGLTRGNKGSNYKRSSKERSKRKRSAQLSMESNDTRNCNTINEIRSLTQPVGKTPGSHQYIVEM